MKGPEKARRIGAVMGLLWGLWLMLSLSVRAEGETDKYDYSEVQDTMDEVMEEAPSFSSLVESMVSGNAGEMLKDLPGYLKNSLFSEIRENRKSLGHVLLIAAFGTIFSGLAASFQDKQAGETGFYVTYLLLLSLLLTAF